MIKKLATLAALAVLTSAAQAQINVFTDHQVVYMTSHGVNKNDDVRFKTGDYPYIGQIGIEYQRQNWSYQLSFIHRSNVDLHGDEYNYNGVSVGVKYAHCVAKC